MKKYLVFIILICSSQYILADTTISEIMYNPSGSDNNKEFIELYHEQWLNFSGYIIGDAGSNDTLQLIYFYNSPYSLIVEEGFDYTEINASIYSVGATIGNNLNNDGDNISFYYPNGSLIGYLSYSSAWGADNNGYSLEFYNGDWYESSIIGGTPGSGNSFFQNQTEMVEYVHDGDTLNLTNGEWIRLIGINAPEIDEYYYEEAKNRLKELVEGESVILERDLENRDAYDRLLRYVFVDDLFVNLALVEEGFAKAYPFPLAARYEDEFADAEERAKNSKLGIWSLSQNYTALKINEFLPNPEGYDDAPMPGGEWIELHNPTNIEIELEWMFFKDLAGHTLYVTDTTVANTTIIPANGYLVVYTNGKSGFLNNEGQETLFFYNESGGLIKNVSYADPVEGNSYAYAEGIGWQHTKPTPNENNADYLDAMGSYLGIENIYDLGSNGKAEFGQSIRIKLQVYKGDTAKDSIALWIEDDKNNRLSKQSKTNVYTRYTNYTLTLPIQIEPNCDESFEDNNYTIRAEGLDASDAAEVYIKGITKDLCEEIEIEKTESKSKFEYELVESPDTIKAGEDFPVKVRLTNNDDEIHKVDIWSYVFRGNKCYSCVEERDENKKMITLPKKDSVEVKLKNKVDKAEPGDYKLKIALIKDDQKTIHDITAAVSIAEDLALTEEYCKEKVLSAAEETEGTEEVTEAPLQILNKDMVLESIKEPRTIYASTNIKIRELIPVFIITTLTIFCSVLVWKR